MFVVCRFFEVGLVVGLCFGGGVAGYRDASFIRGKANFLKVL